MFAGKSERIYLGYQHSSGLHARYVTVIVEGLPVRDLVTVRWTRRLGFGLIRQTTL